jgi:hypothetical protein
MALKIIKIINKKINLNLSYAKSDLNQKKKIPIKYILIKNLNCKIFSPLKLLHPLKIFL